MSKSDYDYLFKVVLVGNSSVGKTSLMRRFADNNFDGSTQKATVGVQFDVIIIPLHSGKKAKLQVWDTAGQERFRAISAAYYRGASAIVLVFGLNDQKSFDDIRYWLSEVQQHHEGLVQKKKEVHFAPDDDDDDGMGIGDNTTKAPLLYLFGNKSDIPINERIVIHRDAEAYAESVNMVYKETSASIGTGVYDAFLQMTTQLEKQANRFHDMEIAQQTRTLMSSQKSTAIKLQDDVDVEKPLEKKCNC